jgi:hypothetical protein
VPSVIEGKLVIGSVPDCAKAVLRRKRKARREVKRAMVTVSLGTSDLGLSRCQVVGFC